MNLAMDEKLKHRLVGLAVFISLCAIVAPLLMRKTNQNFDSTLSIAVKMPQKPVHTHIAIPEKSNLFQQVKVAQVVIPSIKTAMVIPTVVSSLHPLKMPDYPVKMQLAAIPQFKPKPILRTDQEKVIIKSSYAVQVAYFSKQRNALKLTNHLKGKGYPAYYKKIMRKNSVAYYKVFVGNLAEKREALELKQQLASALALKGLIVPFKGVA